MNRSIPLRPSLRVAALLLAAAAVSGSAPAALSNTPAWIAKSNAQAQLLLDVLSKNSPEFASTTGIPGFDEKVADLSLGATERARADTLVARDELANRQAFNDFLIGQGLLPPDLLAKAVREQFIPAQQTGK
ncbi:MAG: hypothetical protein JWQ62_2738 [Lacunisphaera sp.]|nr:hypothetical protein [Lacunisphaera sp.]